MADVDSSRIVFLGPPNSGKGTQAVRLAETLEIPPISTGEMLRQAVTDGSELGLRVEAVMNRGDLVSDELMAEVVRNRLARPDAEEGFLLDGYPRTLPQAATLDAILASRDVELHDVVLLDAPEEVLVARALGRGRKDDREAVVRERIRVYFEKTAPLVELYDERGLLRRVDGDHEMDRVERAILDSLEGGPT